MKYWLHLEQQSLLVSLLLDIRPQTKTPISRVHCETMSHPFSRELKATSMAPTQLRDGNWTKLSQGCLHGSVGI